MPNYVSKSPFQPRAIPHFGRLRAEVLWANEKDDHAVITFRHNFPDVRSIHKPIEQVTVGKDHLEPVDVLTAGFPCQPFSVAGLKKGFDDSRGTLFLDIIRIIKEFGSDKPKILLLENVSNFRSHDDGRTFRRVQHEIQHAGYWFTGANAQIVNTATHSTIPQNRSRIFMVAMSCNHYSRNTFQFPPKLQKSDLQSLWSFINRRKKVDDWYYFKEDSQYHPLFARAIAEAGDKSIFQLRRSYVRENKSNLCFTLMANMGVGGHNQPVIKDRWGIRKLTEIECARLQGFSDDWFEFPEDVPLYQRYKQVGNSVTVPLVRQMSEQIIKLIATAKHK